MQTRSSEKISTAHMLGPSYPETYRKTLSSGVETLKLQPLAQQSSRSKIVDVKPGSEKKFCKAPLRGALGAEFVWKR